MKNLIILFAAILIMMSSCKDNDDNVTTVKGTIVITEDPIVVFDTTKEYYANEIFFAIDTTGNGLTDIYIKGGTFNMKAILSAMYTEQTLTGSNPDYIIVCRKNKESKDSYWVAIMYEI